jgi:hypothetical protein
MGWIRVTALLCDIAGGMLLVIAVLRLNKKIATEQGIDDQVVNAISADRTYVIVAAMFLSIAFLLLIIYEITNVVYRKKYIISDVRYQADAWLEVLNNVQQTEGNKLVISEMKQIFFSISTKKRA